MVNISWHSYSLLPEHATRKMDNMATNMEYKLEHMLEKTDKRLTLKEEQKYAVENPLSGRDVLAILPTGFGKSLIFQLFATAKSIQATRNNSSPGTVLVICPLDSIAKDQVGEAKLQGLKAATLQSDTIAKLSEHHDVLFA